MEGEPLPAILIDDISHPPQSLIPAHLICGLRTQGSNLVLVGVPKIDGQETLIHQWGDIAERVRAEIQRHLVNGNGGEFQVLRLDEIRPQVKDAYFQFRAARKEDGEIVSLRPAWKPLEQEMHKKNYLDASDYSDAEYTFYRLPNAVRDYINSYLGEDERILYAIHRPEMKSQLRGSFLNRQKLTEGFLVLTTQRLIQLIEIIPLEDNGVRYGYSTQTGILERLEKFSIERPNPKSILLMTFWKSRDGIEALDMEFTGKDLPSLKEMSSLLEKFQPGKISRQALRRASPPPAADPVPALFDPAEKDQKEVKILQERFSSMLPGVLSIDEQLLAWAFLPAWLDSDRCARVLCVSYKRLLVLPDPTAEKEEIQEIQFSDVTTLEYAASVVSSFIGFHVFEDGQVREVKINFPYPSLAAFKRCFDITRQCIAILGAI
jgi:hypothetical protein